MNKKLLLSLFLGIGLASSAQMLQNTGLETWSSTGFYEDPDGWGTSNIAVLLGGSVSVEKSTDHHGGMYSAKMTTTEFTFQGQPVDIPGAIFYGNFDMSTYQPAGKGWTERTDSVVFWYKYTPAGGDMATIGGSLTHWDAANQTQEMIATMDMTLPAAATWTRVSVPFQYGTSTSNPDTMLLVIGSGPQTGATPGSVMYTDDVTTVKNPTLGLQKESKEIAISVFPSPADNHLTINMAKDATLEVYNALGQRVYSARNASKSFSIATDDFVNGVYMVRTSNGLTQRFVVKH